MKQVWTGAAIAVAALALDRVTKLWIKASVGLYDTIEVVPGLFNIVHSENRGMAFGLGNEGATWVTRLALIAVSVAVLGALAYGVYSAGRQDANAASLRGPSRASSDALALFLVAGGAIGNLYDRVVHGSVTDFLDVFVGQYHWPTFNVADMAITVGALWIAFNALRDQRKPGKNTVAA